MDYKPVVGIINHQSIHHQSRLIPILPCLQLPCRVRRAIFAAVKHDLSTVLLVGDSPRGRRKVEDGRYPFFREIVVIRPQKICFDRLGIIL
jgi:hypothetical protein